MSKPLLTFELTQTGDTVEIHADLVGLTRLIKTLQNVLERGEHEHLMTPRWGGAELSEEKQGRETKLLDHVKVILWE